MGAFDDVKMTWNGKDYTIPASSVFEVACRIEEVIPIPVLCKSLSDGTPSFTKVARAYGAALRFAGANVTDEQIYSGMFGSTERQSEIMVACQALLAVLLPKDVLEGMGKPAENPPGRRRGKGP